MSQRRSGVSSFYGFDLAGNTRALVSPAAAITDSYSYKAFGPELPGSGGTTNPHRYCGVLGYYRDNSTRQYVRARHLRADVGRWMSTDPIEFDGGDANLYRYAGNNPLTAADPEGLSCLSSSGTGGLSNCLELELSPTCKHCALAIDGAYNSHWEHHCNHPMTHCFLCCVLTVRKDSECACTAQ